MACFMCLARDAEKKLTCGHRLCNPCVIMHGSSPPSDQWAYRITHCPLCQEFNREPVALRPPTTGIRVLSLAGPEQSKFVMLKFLADIQSRVGLVLHPLCEYFDLIIGSGIGTSHVSYLGYKS